MIELIFNIPIFISILYFSESRTLRHPQDITTSLLRAFNIPTSSFFKKSYTVSYYNPSPYQSSYPSAYPSHYPYSYPYPATTSYPYSLDGGYPGEYPAGQPGGQSIPNHCISTGTPAINRTEKFEIKGKCKILVYYINSGAHLGASI